MNKLKLLSVIFLALCVNGCATYQKWEALIIVINQSSVAATIWIDGIEQGVIQPGATANYYAEVQSASSYNNGTSPTTNRTTTVVVTFRNEMTQLKFSDEYCYVGERLKTRIIYTGGSNPPRCSTVS